MTDLTFYTNPMSRGRIVRWMLEEVDQPYDTQVMGYGPAMKSADYLAVNPMGKVPAIRHGEVVVTEVAAICAYLADAYPAAGLAPEPADRADYYRWLFFAAGPVEQAVTVRSLGIDVPQDKQAMVGFGTLDQVVDVLDQAVAGRGWIAGSRFSAADVYVGSQIMWGMMFGSLPKRPSFEAYAARLATRPAYVRATGLDDADQARIAPDSGAGG